MPATLPDSFSAEDAGSALGGSCIARAARRMFRPGRGTSRKERGHRGVRPRHPEAGAPFGSDLAGGFLDTARLRVRFR